MYQLHSSFWTWLATWKQKERGTQTKMERSGIVELGIKPMFEGKQLAIASYHHN